MTDSSFSWISALGVSVMLFLLSGIIHVAIGIFAPFMMDTAMGKSILIISSRTDTEFYGAEPASLIAGAPWFAKLRSVVSWGAGAMILIVGLFIIALAWFGLRSFQPWALTILGITGALEILGWLMTLRPYHLAGIRFSLSDLPPVFWIPAALLLPALILGMMGLKAR